MSEDVLAREHRGGLGRVRAARLWLVPRLASSQGHAKRVVWMVSGGAVAMGLSAAVTGWAARVLGPMAYGVYFGAFALSNLIVQALSGGLENLVRREVGREDRNVALVPTAIRARIYLALVGVLASGAIVLASGSATSRVVLAVALATAIACDGCGVVLSACLEALERAEASAMLTASRALVYSVVLVVGIHVSSSIWTMVISLLIASIFRLVAAWQVAARHPSWQSWGRAGFLRPKVTRTLTATSPWAISSALLVVGYRVDTLILAHLRGAHATGIFGAAFTVYSAFTLVSSAVVAVVQTPLTRRLRRADGWARSRLALLFVLFAGSAVALCTPAWLVGSQFLSVIYGTAFEQALPVFGILCGAAAFGFISSMCGMLMNIGGLERNVVPIVAFSVVVRIGMDLLLIPRFGAQGAALGALSYEVILAVLAICVLIARNRDVPWAAVETA